MNLVNFKSGYIVSNIITYIGNKRKLLTSIDDIINDILVDNPDFSTCLDAFSGSGIVSRYLRYKGFRVYANDLEDYTVPLNKAFLTQTEDPLEQSDYELLNSLTSTTAPYFSKYYAPQDTQNPDLDNERLFFSHENAVFIDAVLETIQNWPETKKNAALASLIYKMSKHNNTSGVMKGFHRGFGGSKGDCLGRILGKITIDPISYIDGLPGTVYNVKAEDLFSTTDCPEVDIAYLDPPYNGHQYSSNYHLLNSAVKYDFYDPGDMHLPKNKVGIRRDHNKSDFCHRARATDAFEKLFSSIKAKYVILSYNNEGILSVPELETIIKKYFNNVYIVSKDYKKYGGGYGGYKNTKNTDVKELFFVASNIKA